MKTPPVWLAFITAFIGASCSRQAEAPTSSTPPAPTVEIVTAKEQSPSFLAVNRQLELGGTLYGYVDIDGDMLKVTGLLRTLLTQMSASQPELAKFADRDLGAIATRLGLTDVKAVGFSSVPDGTGYFRNRIFYYVPGERTGLLKGFGGPPGPFKYLKWAPADTTFYYESEVDVAEVYRTIKAVVAQVAGEEVGTALEDRLKQAGEAATLSILDLIYGLKGHTALVLRIDPEKTIPLPTPQRVTLPAFSFFICIDGVGGVIEKSLADVPILQRTDNGSLHVYQAAQMPPIAGFEPAIVIDGSTLFITTSLPFLMDCRSQTTGLADDPAFQAALDQVGHEGNGLAYVSPDLSSRLQRLQDLNPQLPDQAQASLKLIVNRFANTPRPLVSVRTNLDDGILVRSYLNRSMKQEVAMFAVYNPFTTGLMAAMAIPAFQRVRLQSQQTAVMNNLRMLGAAADQYYLENGVDTATYEQLVGPDRFIRSIQPVAGEDYRNLRFRRGEPLRVTLPDGRVVEYGP